MSLTYYPRYVLWVPFRRAFIASVYISFLNHHLLADWASAFYSPCLTSSLNTVNFVLFSVYSGGMSELCPTVEKEMATHSSTLGWKIPWMEEPGSLQSMGLLRVTHDWATSLSLFTFMHWRRKWQPTPMFLPGESQGQGSLVGCRLCGCTESDTTEVT